MESELKVMSVENVNQVVKQLESAFLEIQQPRTNYAIEHFVLGQHDTDPQKYLQCVLELQIKYDDIRRSMLIKRKIQIEIDRLSKSESETDQIDAEIKKIDLEGQDRAMLGALREFTALYTLWDKFDKKYTRAEIDADQPVYWSKRLERQALNDLRGSGRVQHGNVDALRQIGKHVQEDGATIVSEQSQIEESVRQVEQRYLAQGNTKIVIVVPTKDKTEDLKVLASLSIPGYVQVKFVNVYALPVADAYNHAVKTTLEDNADYMLTVEDDTFPPEDALYKLLELIKDKPKTIVGAWYPKRSKIREGTAIVYNQVRSKREALMDDGKVHEVYTIPQGCTLIPMAIFKDMSFPWFATTPSISQDSFFSQRARDAGWTLLCDTSIRCKHVDRTTLEVFE